MLVKISKAIRILSNVCIVVTVIVCLVFSVFVVPRVFGISPFVVQSASMEPAIPTGSVVFVNTKDKDVEEGDIITYSLSAGGEGVFVTHRVNQIDADTGLIQTKGDNNDNADGWLEKTAVIGTVAMHVPGCGFVLDSLQKTGFVLIAIWVLAVNGILMLIPHVLDAIEDKEK